MSLQKQFGNKIKELRKAYSYSQEEFAEKLGIHRNSLVKIENGQGFASAETIENIHNFLNISYNELFNFSEKVEKNSLKAIILKLRDLSDDDI